MKPIFQNHKQTYDDLFRLYGNVAYYAAYTVLHDGARSEAAVLEGFRRLLPFLARLETMESGKAKYLLVLLTRRAAWKMANLPINEQRPACEPALRQAQSELGDIATLMWELPELQQEVLLLKYDYGFKRREIGALLDMSPEKVTERLRLAQETLALRVIREGEEDG